MSVGSVGGVGSVGSMGSGGVVPSQGTAGAGAAEQVGAPAMDSSNNPAGSPQVGGDVNINSNNTSINIIQMSTQDFMSLHSGCQAPGAGGVAAAGGAGEGGMDFQKLIEMMMVMMMLKMMQEMMQQMSM